MRSTLVFLLLSSALCNLVAADAKGLIIYKQFADSPDDQAVVREFGKITFHSGSAYYNPVGSTTEILVPQNRLISIIEYPDYSKMTVVQPDQILKVRQLAEEMKKSANRVPSSRTSLLPHYQATAAVLTQIDSGMILVSGQWQKKAEPTKAEVLAVKMADGSVKKFEGGKVIGKTEDTLRIMHSSGSTSIPFLQLSEAVQKQHGYVKPPPLELTMADGSVKKFEGGRVTGTTPENLQIVHLGGSVSIPFVELSKATQRQHGYIVGTNNKAFINTLGMTFLPVPGTNVLFCEHETRVADYAAYADENPGVNLEWKNFDFSGHQQTPDHPVINVSWEDAQAFCEWLSKKEGKPYRFPTDFEWSLAVGIGSGEAFAETPEERAANTESGFKISQYLRGNNKEVLTEREQKIIIKWTEEILKPFEEFKTVVPGNDLELIASEIQKLTRINLNVGKYEEILAERQRMAALGAEGNVDLWNEAYLKKEVKRIFSKKPLARFPWDSNSPPNGIANLSGTESASPTKIDGYRDGFPFTAPIGSFELNHNGIKDLFGNVFEWCQSQYDKSSTSRVLRGGSWHDDGSNLSSWSRLAKEPTFRFVDIGFRCVLPSEDIK